MNRAFSPLIPSVLLALLAVTATAAAVEEPTAAAHAPAAAVKPDAGKGATLYADGDAARGLPACVSCHGAAGNSTIAANPVLAGQGASYLYKQLVEFTTPKRNQPVMSTYAKMLSDADKKNVAAYLAAQVPKPGAAKNKDTIELGKKIFRGGIASKQIAACASCHGATGDGIPVQYPRIAGQHQEYTVTQLTLFRSTKPEARRISADMQVIASRLSDDEMAAVADYIAGLK